MKLALVLAATLLLASFTTAGIVASCRSGFRDGACGACVSSSEEGSSSTDPSVACAWCPASSAGGASTCVRGDAASCAGRIDASNANTCPDPSGGGGGSSGCTAAAHAECASAPAPPPCRNDQLPLPGDAPGCCPSCTMPCQSGVTTPAGTPFCMPGRLPRVFFNNCTRSCAMRPPCDLSTISTTLPECSATNPPSLGTNGCPSCRVPANRDCSAVSCSSVAVCAAGTFPALPDTAKPCCPDCRPTAPCASATCASSYSTLRACAASEEPSFDSSTCCPSCRRTPPTGGRPPATGSCTRDQVTTCLAAAPICKTGEDRVFDAATSCCASCKRIERACSLKDVSECATNTRECASGEFPAAVEGRCCPTCRPAAPTCATACSATEICIARPPLNGVDQANVCRGFTTRTFSFDSTDATRVDELKTFDGPRARAVLFEMVERACSAAEFSTACAKYRAMIVRSSLCTRTSTAGETPVVIECKIPNKETSTRAADDSPAALVDASVTAESGEYAVKDTSATSPAVGLVPSTLLAFFLIAFAPIAVAMF